MSFYENDGRRVRHHLEMLEAAEASRLAALDAAAAQHEARIDEVSPVHPVCTDTP